MTWYLPTVTFCIRKIKGVYCVGSLSEEGTEHELWWPIADFNTEKEAQIYLAKNYPVSKMSKNGNAL